MKWYLTKLVFQIICGEGTHQAQFDEQLRLVAAENEDVAFSKAVAFGKEGGDTFYNQKDQLVEWRFINVTELYQIDMIDGAELNSRITEKDDAATYIDMVHDKAEQIQQKHVHKLLHLL